MDARDSQRTELDEVGRLLQEQRKLLEMIATGVPLDDCLAALCGAVPRLSPGTRACILLADEDCTSFPRSISPDLAPSFAAGLKDAPINDLAIGTCGEALYRGQRVSCPDIRQEEKWSEGWRKLCVEHGVLACVSEPILANGGSPFGSFMLCFSEPREATERELRMIKFGTYVASIALARDRTVRALEESEARYRTLFSSIDAGFCVLEMVDDEESGKVDFRILEANPTFERMTGLQDVAGKMARGFAPGLREDWYRMLVRVALTGEPVRVEKAAWNRWFQLYSYRVDQPQDRRVALLFDEITPRVRQERNLKFMASISQELAQSRTAADMMKTVGASIGQFMGLSVCAFAEIDEKAETASVTYDWHRADVPGAVGVFTLADYLTEDFQATGWNGEVFAVRDTETDPRVRAKLYELLKIRSFLTVPIVRDHQWRFALCVYHSHPHEWREDEIELLRRLARRVWTRLQSARMEEALHESERKLRQIFEAARDYAIFSCNPRGYVNSWSPGAERIFGYTEREVIGRHFELIFTSTDRAEQVPRLELERALKEGVAEDERWHQRKDGSRFFVSGLTQPILDRGGKLVGFTKICRDRTAHQQAREWLERELVDSQRLQAVSARLIAEGDFPVLLEEILQAAVAITRAHMGTVHLVEGKNSDTLRLLVASGFEPGVLAKVRHVEPDDTSSCSVSIRAGERVVIPDLVQSPAFADSGHAALADYGVRAAQWTPLVSRSGKLLGVIATHWRQTHRPGERELRLLDLLARQAADLIERHQSEAALREREQQLIELSHSLERRVEQRTAELSEQTARLQSLAAELASAEQRERKRLAAMLHDDLQQLLVAASMQLGSVSEFPNEDDRTALAKAEKWLNEARLAARDLTRQLRPPALYEDGLIPALHWLASEMRERHHLQVTIDGTEPAQTLSDDIKALLFECIRELLFNAAKHARVTEASVTLREDDDGLHIVVSDPGVGFDVQEVDSWRQSGGFGLFSIRERLIALGGEMVMRSAPGQGSSIELRAPTALGFAFPLARQGAARPHAAAGSREPETAAAPDSRIKVLVVDDHPMIREGIANILAGDCRLAISGQAADGVEAIESVERDQPDVVLMDVNMPRMNGIEAAREIRRRWPETCIIGLSVQDDPTTAKSMCDAGAAAFISKSDASVSMISAILRQVPEKPSALV